MSLNRRVFYFYLSPVLFCTWSPGWTTPQTPRCTRARCIKRPPALVCCPRPVKMSLIIVWLNLYYYHHHHRYRHCHHLHHQHHYNRHYNCNIIVIIIVSLLSSTSSSSRRHRHSLYHHHHYRCHYHTNFSEDFHDGIERQSPFELLGYKHVIIFFIFFNFFFGAEDLLLLLSMIKLDIGKPCKATCCRAV